MRYRLWKIAHGGDMGISMDIHDVIARLCYRRRAELSMHFFGRIGRQKGLMEHLSVKDEVLSLAGVSPGSGVLHQEV